MQLNLDMPLAGAAVVARAAERNGFAGIAFTDHPAPSKKWLDAGGHETFDPFAALAYCAAITSRVRLMTHLVVLPYRNPMLLAKSVATVDRLSDGRLTLVVGTGYLRSEFLALGRSFDERNVLADEALEVLTTAFTTDGFTYEGTDFRAVGQICAPGPVQLPHPPIWLGGNSRKSRERVARCGQGWAPMLATGPMAGTVRTARLETLDDLARGIDDLRQRLADAGRDPAAVAVQCEAGMTAAETVADPEGFRSRLDELAALGVTHVMLSAGRRDPHEAEDTLDAFGAIARDLRPV